MFAHLPTICELLNFFFSEEQPKENTINHRNRKAYILVLNIKKVADHFSGDPPSIRWISMLSSLIKKST